MFQGASILVTGATGSFGHAFIERILTSFPEVERVVAFSRDELKQYEMQLLFPRSEYPQLYFMVGDIRDYQRVRRAMDGIDIVVHAAALKHVPVAEHNPFECIQTNVLGAQNIIDAALDWGVSQVVALSTDKAASPVNLYGAAKMCADKLFTNAVLLTRGRDIRFSVVRYGNVLGSRGSVLPHFLKQRETGRLTLTHKDMTRFSISMGQEVDMVLYALTTAWGGELYVPKLPSYRLTDLAEAVAPSAEKVYTGIRAGEKLFEEMITATDSQHTIEYDNHYVICPTTPTWRAEERMKALGGKPVPYGFEYNSTQNSQWLDVEALRAEIRAHVDPNFEPL